MSGVSFGFLLGTGGAECALIWLSIAYCEGMHLGYVVQVVSVLSKLLVSVVSELVFSLVPVVLSLCLFLEEPVFCFCMTGVEPFSSVFEGSCLV